MKTENLSEFRISRKKHVESIQKEIQELNKKCDSKSYVRFANDNFLVFHVHNQKHKLKDDSQLEDALAAIDYQYQPFRTRVFRRTA